MIFDILILLQYIDLCATNTNTYGFYIGASLGKEALLFQLMRKIKLTVHSLSIWVVRKLAALSERLFLVNVRNQIAFVKELFIWLPDLHTATTAL